MVRIRLRREGKKGYPVYKLVATDKRSPRDGGYLEALGQYNPNINPIALNLKESRIEYWLRKGAQPTVAVRSLLKRTGFWLRWTLTRQGKDEETIKNVMEKWNIQHAEKLKREAEKKTKRPKRRKKSEKAADAPAQAQATT